MDIIGSDIVSILINIFLPMYLASFLSENKNKFDTKCIWLTICIIVFNIYYCIIKSMAYQLLYTACACRLAKCWIGSHPRVPYEEVSYRVCSDRYRHLY